MRGLLEERGCEALLALGADHVVHLTGYARYLGGPTAVVLLPDGERVLVVPRFELEPARAQGSADRIVAYGPPDFLEFGLERPLLEMCRSLAGSARLAIASDAPLAEPAAVDIGAELAAVRRVKDEDELARIRLSYAAALAAQSAIAAAAAEGAAEIELFSLGRAVAERHVGAPVDYIATVAGGPGSTQIAPPMHVASDVRVDRGDVLLVDVSVRHDGYWGDSARTRTPGGQPDATHTREALEAIKEEAVSGLLPGRRASEVYADMRQAIASAFPGRDLVHHAGHGIGIAVGEDPQLIPSEQLPLETGMVLTLEPGVYHPGRFGVRVEDMYVVTPAGGELLRVEGAG